MIIKPHWWFVIPIILFAVIIASLHLNADPIFGSEYESYSHIGFFATNTSPSDTWHSVADNSPQHGPLYFVTLLGWAQLVGRSVPAMRALSLLLGVLTIAWSYRLGRDVISPQAGLFAAFFVAVSAFFIFYMHEVRMYSMLPGLAALVMWGYWRVMSDEGRPSWAIWLTLYLGSVALLYTHYFGIFPLLSLGVYHLLIAHKTRRWWTLNGVMALVGVSFLPWLPVVIDGTTNRTSLEASALRSPEVIYNFMVIFSNNFVPLFIVVAASSLLYVNVSRLRQRNILFVFMMFGVAFAAIVLLNREAALLPARRLRYMLTLWPSMALIAALGLVYLTKWRPLVSGVMLAWVVVAVLFTTSTELGRYTNRLSSDFVDWIPLHRMVAAFEANEPTDDAATPVLILNDSVRIPNRIFDFYGFQLDRPLLQLREDTLDAVNFETLPSFWLIYQSDAQLEMLSVYEDGMIAGHRLCETRLSQDAVRLDYYVDAALPCDVGGA